MYMPLIMCGYAVALLLTLLGCLVAMRTVPGLRGVRLLTWAMASGLVGVLLTGTRLFAPPLLTILLANELIFAAYVLIYCCAARILSVRAVLLGPGIALSLLATAANAWFTWVHPGLTQRILIGSSLSSVYEAATAVILLRGGNLLHDPVSNENAGRVLPRALGLLQLSLVGLNLTRFALTSIFSPSSFIHLDLIQAGFTYINMLLYLGTVAGLVWLALCVHRSDLQAMAHTDSLTGLLNRRAFEDVLSRAMRRSHLSGSPLAVLLLDIDRFKEVNDSLGHPAGDEVLRGVGAALRESTRPGDALARYGGEEFVVLMRECSLDHAQEAAERLRMRVAGLSGLPGALRITVSIGVAASLPDESPSEFLSRCDQALYLSKRGGRNLVTAHHRTGMDAAPGLA